jgi:tetratricopeptide (TPR) repeat protein
MGRMAEAERYYRRVLGAMPTHADAMHLLGTVASATGHHDRAVKLIGRAIQQNRRNPAYHGNLGVALQGLNRADEAIASYDRAIDLDPALAEAHFNRGNALRELGRLVEAVASYERAIALKPEVAEVYSNRGNALRDLHRLDEAIASYDQAITRNPALAEVHYNRGNALRDLERLDEAVASYDRAIALAPDMAEAYCNRGVALTDFGRLDEALESYDQALNVRPDYTEALIDRGLALQRLGRSDEALASYDRVLAVRPDYPEALNNRGNALREGRRFTEALASYDRALFIRPDDAEVLNNRGLALHGLKSFADALESYDRALAVRQDYVEVLINRAPALRQLERFDEALESCDRALAIRPDSAEGLLNRGGVMKELGRFDEALQSYDRALALRPDYAEALNNRGLVFDDLDSFNEALQNYDRALACRPDYADALNNRGTTLEQLRRFEEALDSYNHVLAANPDDDLIQLSQFNKALLLMRMGQFSEGWEGYEWRRKGSGWDPRTLVGPEWTGGDPSDKRLLFYSEQGLGDTIQFSRLASSVATRGGKVFLEAQPSLCGLLTSLEGVMVLRQGEPLPEFDAHLPLMSLPRVLGVTPESMVANVPYLFVEPDRVKAWSKRLSAGQLRVGIAWQGQPITKVDKGRSIPLHAFAPLCRIPGLTLISLQKHHGVDQLAHLPPGMRVETFGVELDPGPDAFLDSAAVMMNLDLVISCDTAIAHLAGALGCPVWIVLKHVPDWRWMIDKEHSSWYPTARLFRQYLPGDWDQVVARIATELTQVASGERDRLLPQGHRSPPTRKGRGGAGLRRVSMPQGRAFQEAPSRASGCGWNSPRASLVGRKPSTEPLRTPGVGEPLLIPVAVAELLDKITILEIKHERIADPAKLLNIRSELDLLRAVWYRRRSVDPALDLLIEELKKTNEILWEVEDDIRECEKRQDFGRRFIELARAVYRNNDRRFALKRQIDESTGSALIEEKSYGK